MISDFMGGSKKLTYLKSRGVAIHIVLVYIPFLLIDRRPAPCPRQLTYQHHRWLLRLAGSKMSHQSGDTTMKNREYIENMGWVSHLETILKLSDWAHPSVPIAFTTGAWHRNLNMGLFIFGATSRSISWIIHKDNR